MRIKAAQKVAAQAPRRLPFIRHGGLSPASVNHFVYLNLRYPVPSVTSVGRYMQWGSCISLLLDTTSAAILPALLAVEKSVGPVSAPGA
ncbi:MAG TPA: hypothetical protein PK859_04040 [Spirochaetota bacterium]|nr:hypothetical protein [Spirochaetota bacterium]HPR48819.1 hypothetical protein [Spirochaetota bacterium]